MTDFFKDVRDFHNKFGLSSEDGPMLLSPEEQKFRIKCLYEELQEYERAVANGDLPEQLDALIDLAYFTLGTAHRCGFRGFGHAWDRVHQANMTKALGDNGVEITKPSGWQGPQLDELYQAQTALNQMRNCYQGLITVDGPDGSGKSTLANRIALLFGGEVIHLTWTVALDAVMDLYRLSAIEYASALAKDRVVVLERPWLSHPIYSHVYRNDYIHSYNVWRTATEEFQNIGIITLPENRDHWLADYAHSCETRDEHYSQHKHEKMGLVYDLFHDVAYQDSNELFITPLDRSTHVLYNYQSVEPVSAIDDWISANLKDHLGVKEKCKKKV